MTGRDKRGVRRFWMRGALIAFLGAAALVLWPAFGPGPGLGAFSTRGAIQSAGLGPVPEQQLLSAQWIHLQPGGTPAEALLDAGLRGDETYGALQAFQEVMPVEAIQPRDAITLFTDRNGTLVCMELQRFPQRKIVVEATNQGFAARREYLPTQTRVRRLDGEVASTLYEAVHTAGGNDAVLVNFAELFAWSFDFATETRVGDAFTMLVEETWINGEPLGGGRVLYGEYRPVRSKPLDAFYYAGGEDEVAGYYTPDGKSIKKRFLKSPLNFTRISSHFSYNRMHPILKRPRPHLGIDYAAPSGTPVVSIGSGRVVFAGWIKGFGKTVKVRHGDGYLSQYAHLSRIRVNRGAHVGQNQVIGNVGSTGLSTGPHLDFRVQQNGKWINPLRLKGGSSPPLPASHQDAFQARVQELKGVLTRMDPGASIAWTPQGPSEEGSVEAE